MKTISIVLPCRNESKNLPLLIPEIIRIIPKQYDFEIICVDDGSEDTTSEVLQQLAKKNKKVKALLFHRWFGHQAALRAGIRYATGEAVITMDSDFQHPPALIPKFLKKWEQGYDLIQARKESDITTNFLKRKQRAFGYLLWTKVSDGVLLPGISEFRLMDRHIANYVRKSREREFLLRGLVMIAAHNPTTIGYSVGKRKHGKSSYSISMFLRMFVNGFLGFSTKPIRVASIFGLTLFSISAVLLILDILRAVFLGEKIIQGWTTAVLLITLLNGILFIYLGLLGEYISIIFKEVKRRPNYIIRNKINL